MGVFLGIVNLNYGQLNLPKPTNQTHAFDFARYLDVQVSPVKEQMDFFFTAFGSADSIQLSKTLQFLNKHATNLFTTVDGLPRQPETTSIIDAYLDFARFCMNSRATIKMWVDVSGRYQWANRVGKPIPESIKAVWLSVVNIRKGYIQQTKSLLQKHNEFCSRHAKDFELYPSQRVLELLQDLKFGNASSKAVFIDAVANLSRYENGQRYVFDLGIETKIQQGSELEALKENISYGLPENAYTWHNMRDVTHLDHHIVAMYSARYSKPSAPVMLIRYSPELTNSSSYLKLELYSVVPSFLKPLP